MYYNKLNRVWVIDSVDFFILTFLIGNLITFCTKDYISERASINQINRSILSKSRLLSMDLYLPS
jgi:hypothetical protein